ncbi:HAMP domain-containing histidine kinase [Christensenellaceae bacterium OttesenSCG-928-K19]|nr:HAMP domain-containing histidine kinase [Christensenellaceae bacterium OttesenSCG-928-K19]
MSIEKELKCPKNPHHNNVFAKRLIIVIVLIAVVLGLILFAFSKFNMQQVEGTFLIHSNHKEEVRWTYECRDKDGAWQPAEVLFSDLGYFEEIRIPEQMDMASVSYRCVLPDAGSGMSLFVPLPNNAPVILFLDDEVLYSDFESVEGISLKDLPDLADGIYQRYGEDDLREIVLALPGDYAGNVFTVIEYRSAEELEFWEPMTVFLNSMEAERAFGIVAAGSNLIIIGIMITLLGLLIALFAYQAFSGAVSWQLLLPIMYLVLQMLGMSDLPYFSADMQTARSFLTAVANYCAADLLLLYFVLNMKGRIRFVPMAVSLFHMGYVIMELASEVSTPDEFFWVSEWLNVLQLGVCIFAFVLMARGWKSGNRFFKHAGKITLAFVVALGVYSLLSWMSGDSMYYEIYLMLEAPLQLNFGAFLQLLSIYLLVLTVVLAIKEYFLRFMERRAKLETLERIDVLKTQFLGNVSHDLKTPLTVMRSYAQLSRQEMEGMPGTDRLKRNMELINSESERLALMISQILDVTRIDEGRMQMTLEPCSIVEIIQQTMLAYYPVYAKNNNALEFEQDDDIPLVLCDRYRIQQVLVNLISNASRHTRNGKIIISAHRGDGVAVIRIADNGEGIPAMLLPHVFDRYKTTENAVGGNADRGTGLGLFICRYIIEAHDGEIWVESNQGKGATITFTLPLQT